ncbi:MAG: M48 family metalloprotease [Castellaniella sp.]
MSACVPFLSKRTIRQLSAGLMALATAMAPLHLSAQPTGIPSMGAASGVELSPAVERSLGDAIMEQGRRDPAFVSDPDVTHYLTGLGRELAAHAPGGAGQHVSVFALRDSQINAFALPGGYIGIHTGLFVAAESEAELAGVVAHEIGHVLQRHVARGMTQSAQSNHILLASMAGALLAALAGSGDLAMGVAAFGQAAAIDRQLGFSRQAEQEADRVGYEMLQRAGYDPRGMLRMFQRLASTARLNEGTGGNVYTSTHPLSLQRLSDIEGRIRDGDAGRRVDNPEFWYLRARMRLVQTRDKRGQDQAVAIFERDARERKGVEQAAAHYGHAWYHWKQKAWAQAREHLARAQALGQPAPQLDELAILLALDAGDVKTGLQLADQAWRRWPQSQGVAQARVHAFEANGQDKAVVAFTEACIAQWPGFSRMHQLRAQAYERLGEKVAARRAMAQYYESIGALPTAVEQLRQARSLTRDFYLQSELDVQIRTLRDRLTAERALLERFRS